MIQTGDISRFKGSDLILYSQHLSWHPACLALSRNLLSSWRLAAITQWPHFSHDKAMFPYICISCSNFWVGWQAVQHLVSSHFTSFTLLVSSTFGSWSRKVVDTDSAVPGLAVHQVFNFFSLCLPSLSSQFQVWLKSQLPHCWQDIVLVSEKSIVTVL